MATRSNVKMVSMRDFRNNFQRIDEPVKVVRARGDIEVIGTWTPVKKKPNGHEEPQGES